MGGSILVEAPGTLRLQSGTFTQPAGAFVQGAGALQLIGGSATFVESLALTGPVTLNGGTWTFNANQTFATYQQAGGSLRGTGAITITNSFSWTGGAMVDAGRTVLPPGVNGTISSGNQKDLAAGRVLENAGTLVVSGGSFYFNLSNLGGGALINNLAGGILEIQGEADFSHNFGTVSAVNNAGLLRKTGGGVTQFTADRIALNNTGVIEITEGRLRLEGGGSLGGTINVSAGAILSLDNGDYTLSTGVAFLGNGAFEINRPLTLQSAVNLSTLKVTWAGSASVTGAFAISNAPGGELHVNKSMTFPGDMLIGGLLKIATASHTVTIVGTLTLATTGTSDNAGTLRVGAFVDEGGTLIGNPPVVIGLAPSGGVSFKEIKVMKTEPVPAGEGGRVIRLTWEAATAAGYVVEMSTDLNEWKALPVQPTTAGLRTWETQVTVPPSAHCFFRIRWAGLNLQPDR